MNAAQVTSQEHVSKSFHFFRWKNKSNKFVKKKKKKNNSLYIKKNKDLIDRRAN